MSSHDDQQAPVDPSGDIPPERKRNVNKFDHLMIGDDWILLHQRENEDGSPRVGAVAFFYKSDLVVHGLESAIRVKDGATLSLHGGQLYMTGDDGKEYEVRINADGDLYARPRYSD